MVISYFPIPTNFMAVVTAVNKRFLKGTTCYDLMAAEPIHEAKRGHCSYTTQKRHDVKTLK